MDANYLSQHQIPNTTPTTRPFAAPARPQKAGGKADGQAGFDPAELMDIMTHYGAIYEEHGMQAMYDAIEADAAKCPASWFN